MTDLNGLLGKEHEEWYRISSNLRALLDESRALIQRQNAISKNVSELTARQSRLAAEIQKKLSETAPCTELPNV